MSLHLDVFQSMWAMECFDGRRANIADHLERIQAADFRGADVLVVPEASPFDGLWLDALHNTDLDLTLTASPVSTDSFEPVLELATRWLDRLRHVTVIPVLDTSDIEACAQTIQDWYTLARSAGVNLHIETHRGSATQNPSDVLALLQYIPDMRIAGDFSHFVVGQEWEPESLNPAVNSALATLLEHTGSLQGRVASAEQVQVPHHFPQHQEWVTAFKQLWFDGFSRWRERAADHSRMVFLCELGPTPYALTDQRGHELSDRWQEALQLKRWAEQVWLELDQQGKPALAAAVA